MCYILFSGIYLYLSREHEQRRDWLKLFDEHSHCLRGARTLRLYYQGELEEDVVQLVDKLKT